MDSKRLWRLQSRQGQPLHRIFFVELAYRATLSRCCVPPIVETDATLSIKLALDGLVVAEAAGASDCIGLMRGTVGVLRFAGDWTKHRHFGA